jgi:hypothetical protein
MRVAGMLVAPIIPATLTAREARWLPDPRPFNDRFPSIAEAVGVVDNALIDGGAVGFRPDGRSDFGARPPRPAAQCSLCHSG